MRPTDTDMATHPETLVNSCVTLACFCACVWVQTHHAQCPAEPRMYPDIDCEIFDHPTPMTLALSVLVIIEMLNALNRYLPAYLASLSQ